MAGLAWGLARGWGGVAWVGAAWHTVDVIGRRPEGQPAHAQRAWLRLGLGLGLGLGSGLGFALVLVHGESVPVSGSGRRSSFMGGPLEGWQLASKGMRPLPRRRGSALALGCGREGGGALPLARAAAVSTG